MATSLSGAEIAAKWARNTVANKATWNANVQAVQGNPMAKAAAAVNKYADGCARAATDGSFVRGCNRVTEQSWKQACAGKGMRNIDSGVREGETKVAVYLEQALPAIRALSNRIQAMPNNGDADMVARIMANIEGQRQIAAQRRG